MNRSPNLVTPHAGYDTREIDADEPARASKSQKKRDMSALQKLGEELVLQSPERLERVEMPEALRTAIADAQRIHDHEGRRRQMQYIGRVMRDVDVAPIRAALDGWAGASRAESAALHALERWRERLLCDDAALTAFAAAHTAALNPATMQQLRNAIRMTKKERTENKPPKHFRELFQLLKTLVEGTA